MNIQMEALYRYLQGEAIPIQYFFSEDYQKIIEKCEQYKKSKGELPSAKFLLENAGKIADTKDETGQEDRIYDILYVLEKYKSEELNLTEVNELLLEDFKSETVKKLTKQLSLAISKEYFSEVTRLSEEISRVSALVLDLGESWRTNDVKQDIGKGVKPVVTVPIGFFRDTENIHESFTRCFNNSLILLSALTSHGKSVLAIQGAMNNYLDGHSVVYLSYEMSKQIVLARMLSNLSQVEYKEVISRDFQTDEARIRVKAGELTLVKKIEFEDALYRLLKDENDTLDDYDNRENYLKIIAISSAEDNEGDMTLPNNVEILEMLNTYSDIDYFYIDLISEVRFKKSLGSYEQDYAEFAKQLKAVCLKQSTVVFLITQPAGSSGSLLLQVKYSRAMHSSSDNFFTISSTKEMNSDNLAVLMCVKTRNSRNGLAQPMRKKFDVMEFKVEPEFDTITIDDYLEVYSKEQKKLSNEK